VGRDSSIAQVEVESEFIIYIFPRALNSLGQQNFGAMFFVLLLQPVSRNIDLTAHQIMEMKWGWYRV
jgi:hypothetical protein